MGQSRAVVSGSGHQTFAFSAAAFRERYDRQLTSDGDSGIRSCEVIGDLHRWRFDDASFRRSVDALKALDLANGSFSFNASLSFGTSDDRVARIAVRGGRADPMNFFALIRKGGSLVKKLDPTVTQDEITALLTDAGFQHDDQHGAAHPQRAALVRAVRARGYG